MKGVARGWRDVVGVISVARRHTVIRGVARRHHWCTVVRGVARRHTVMRGVARRHQWCCMVRGIAWRYCTCRMFQHRILIRGVARGCHGVSCRGSVCPCGRGEEAIGCGHIVVVEELLVKHHCCQYCNCAKVRGTRPPGGPFRGGWGWWVCGRGVVTGTGMD